jgi:hypothetical protein
VLDNKGPDHEIKLGHANPEPALTNADLETALGIAGFERALSADCRIEPPYTCTGPVLAADKFESLN